MDRADDITQKTYTHYYKGQPVRMLEVTYFSNGYWFCTIEMLNRFGKLQRQTVQVRRLTPYVPPVDALDCVTMRGKSHLTEPGSKVTLCGALPPDGHGRWFYRTKWDGKVSSPYTCKRCAKKVV